jgi:hypothetical protein
MGGFSNAYDLDRHVGSRRNWLAWYVGQSRCTRERRGHPRCGGGDRDGGARLHLSHNSVESSVSQQSQSRSLCLPLAADELRQSRTLLARGYGLLEVALTLPSRHGRGASPQLLKAQHRRWRAGRARCRESSPAFRAATVTGVIAQLPSTAVKRAENRAPPRIKPGAGFLPDTF